MTKGSLARLFAGSTLAFGLLAGIAPAALAGGAQHQGDHVRSGFDTTDWPQGKSLSDPDGDSNGGWDKPGFTAGDEDRDGNNGCGNDTDRADDNNGNCGGGDEAQVGGASEDNDDGCGAECPEAGCGAECPETQGAVVTVGTQTGGAEVDIDTTAGIAGLAASVLGAVEAVPAGMTTPAATIDTPDAQALEITETAPSPSMLARTGAVVAALALLGWLCLGGGRLTAITRRLLGS